MKNFDIPFSGTAFPMIYVEGASYLFGTEGHKLEVRTNDFFISRYPVTQVFWAYIMVENPAFFKGENKPLEHVTYFDALDFLEALNAHEDLQAQFPVRHRFRLPSETEWEYAARGGIYWKDNFMFSGSNEVSEVAWQDDRRKGTETCPVGEKKANQLGIHDMCGNVWEWCEDYYQADLSKIPRDGTPCLLESESRVLRGGCHHNWAVHCTVDKRYEIVPDAKDECIGFRIAVTA
ncbi:SUMF1/EgtB/PvdO family nonheme iron enzyme [Emticicia sp. CRIBPO]|uniref:formylglycine-generating enzyme family protein n=1 Tax=Emticicia sp. CRIBPO TaxID=2683258 RepID=UPI001413047D|nr:formylglycine-generating enzyme family protein [Emticicia sp. CRIBPO]NBA85554.1 SUMF1/EgtB/PvdO family nonheme iron enzyme [Emticicia sp. CRIBPO]